MKIKNKIIKVLSFALIILLIVPTVASCSSCKKKADLEFNYTERTLAGNEIFDYGYFKYQVYTDGTAVIIEYNGSESNLNIPDNLNGKIVVEIAMATFMPSSTDVTKNTGAARLTSVTLNPSLEKIGEYAFYQCVNLSSISFGDKLWSVGFEAFAETPWIKSQTDDFVTVGNGVLIKYQGKETGVNIPDGIRHISSAFTNNEDLRSVTLSDSVLSVGVSSFSGCSSLVSVTFGSNVKLIDTYAFSSCYSLVSAEFPDSLEYIAPNAFYMCYSIKALKLGSSLKKISNNAFDSCTGIRTVEAPATLTVIEQQAFSNCWSLCLVFYGGTEEQFKAINYTGDSGSNYMFKDAIIIYGENLNEK